MGRRKAAPLNWKFNDGLYFAHTDYGHFTLEQERGYVRVTFNPKGFAGEDHAQDMGTYKTFALAKAGANRDHKALAGL